MTKKVGILTFHDASNYGAALQAYATQQAIKELGFNAEFLDYSNSHRKNAYSVKGRLSRTISAGNLPGAVLTLAACAGIWKRNRAFAKFRKESLQISETITTRQQLAEASHGYEFIVAGSDQIWSPKNNGCDTAYLLDFVSSATKTLSYASSFGSIKGLSGELASRYRDALARIGALSVREAYGQRFVNDLSSRSADLVLDPVFLLSAASWTEFSAVKAIPKEPFNFVYLNDNKFRRFSAFELITDVKCQVNFGSFDFRSTINWLRGRQRFLNHLGPREFVAHLLKADLVLTTSYHAVVLSLIFRKEFVVFLSGDIGRDSRILHLLESFSLTDRVITDPQYVPATEPDFTELEKKMTDLRKGSLAFLKTALSQF